MKTIFILISILFIQVSHCQFNPNYLGEDFFEIKINNISMSDIIDAQGDEAILQSYFGSPINLEIGDHPNVGEYYKTLTYNGFTIHYSKVSTNYFNLTSINFTNPTTSLSIPKPDGSEVTIHIGDQSQVLTIFNLNTNRNGDYSYQFCSSGCAGFISINYNQVTKIITEIYFIEQT